MAGSMVKVEGLREFQRACNKAPKDARKEMRKRLKAVGEPVRAEAERLAAGGISNIGPRWSRMKTGRTASGVYVAPRARRGGGTPRPNLAPLLLTRAMIPALTNKSEEVVREFEDMIDNLVRDF